MKIEAQNSLVPNGSFEEFTSCPWNLSQVDSSIGWHRVLNTPDYFATCAPYPVSIPSTIAGFQQSQYGNAYMGLYTYIWYEFWREIIGTELTTPMIPGNVYSVSMRVSRGNSTSMAWNCAASNKLGMRFTTNEYTLADSIPIDNYAQVYVDSFVTDTLNWVLLQWNYEADSAYTHVYIGNFFDDAHTDTLVINPVYLQDCLSYYFIDSVNIICLSASCVTNISELGLNNVAIRYDVNEEQVYISGEVKKAEVVVCNVVGQIIEKENTVGNVTIDASQWSKGIYLVEIKTEKLMVVKKILVL